MCTFVSEVLDRLGWGKPVEFCLPAGLVSQPAGFAEDVSSCEDETIYSGSSWAIEADEEWDDGELSYPF